MLFAVLFAVSVLSCGFFGNSSPGLSGIPIVIAQEAKPSPATQPAAATKEQIERWIRELDANVFAVREEASSRLIAAGTPAVESIAVAIRQGNPEVVVRGVHVLKEIAVTLDDDEDQSVRNALQKIAQS